MGALAAGWFRVVSAVLVLVLPGCGDGDGRGGGTARSAAPPPAATERAAASVDACALVTQADASALFGNPAAAQRGQLVIDPNMLGECLWTWDTETSNQLLQVRIWNGAQSYAAPEDSRPLGLGDQGYLRSHPLGGVDIEWVQGGRTVSLSYSSIGPDVPKAIGKVGEVEQLAQVVAGRL